MATNLLNDARARVPVDVALAQRSESNFYAAFDGTVGVFWATYEPIPVGTRVSVTLILPGGVELVRDAVANWERGPVEDGWPGVGLQFEELDSHLLDRIRSFARFREPMYVPARSLRREAYAQAM